MMKPSDLHCRTLGPCRFDSPMLPFLNQRKPSEYNIVETDRILHDDLLSTIKDADRCAIELPSYEPTGPHKRIFFNPAETRVGIVTCGGLCPGLNDVIRALVMELYHRYNVNHIHGFQKGFQGFIPSYGHDVLELHPDTVLEINEQGGTILGTSRGDQDVSEIVDCLHRMKINILFIIGGDGSMRGAVEIAKIVRERGYAISIVGIPKTIDNDLKYIDQSFGFQTAYSVAVDSIRTAHVEAKAAPNGVGLVKLMGRHSGYIACYASLAKNAANFVLIPEVPFSLDGENGFLALLRERIRCRQHAVIVVAEGAGQEYLRADKPPADVSALYDISGNLKLHDIGLYLKDRILADFAAHNVECNLKYIDPSYMIRSVPANPYDSVYCLRLAHNAVHAAMAGRTEVLIARIKGRFVMMPIELCIAERNQVDPNGDLWMSVLESTGQPAEMR